MMTDMTLCVGRFCAVKGSCFRHVQIQRIPEDSSIMSYRADFSYENIVIYKRECSYYIPEIDADEQG